LKKIKIISALAIGLWTIAGCFSDVNAGQYENPLFGYTHLLPSPFTPPAGKAYLGTQSGIGVTDFLSVETNLLSDFYGIYNARARMSLLDFPGFAAGVNLGYQYYNLNSLSSANPSLNVATWMPGAVIGAEILPYFALFVGGSLAYTSVDLPSSDFDTSGYTQGAQIESDLSWAYNPHKSTIGNVLSAGVSYNTTYKFYGFGVSHHWRGFQLGVHYFPNASRYKVAPIIGGGVAFDL
jgi:hypothetical protein